MSGTDHTRDLFTGGPVIILVEPQLGENIGMVARAMANFGLSELRLVNPRDGWPSDKARAAASRADHVIDSTKVFETLEAAIEDMNHVMATTARQRDMIKPVFAPDTACKTMRDRSASGAKTGILFGRERWGLENHEVALADEIVTFPVNPAFASLNIAQAVLLMSYEWMRSSDAIDQTGFSGAEPVPARKGAVQSLINNLESALEDAHYFYPPDREERLKMNIRSIFVNGRFQDPEIQTLHGIISALERRWKEKSDRNKGE